MSTEDLIDSFRDWYAVRRSPKAGSSRAFAPAYIQVLDERMCFHSTCRRERKPGAWVLIIPTSPTRNQCYMIALTALYLYDYLLTFADEVHFTPDNRPGTHYDFTALLVGQVCMGRKEDVG